MTSLQMRTVRKCTNDAIKKTPVVVDDEIVIRPIMAISLSFDHRIVDGAPAAQFLVRIKELIEEPTLML